ncbi:hypothetical protein [Flavisolibacter nicotianae]|uniref:hypothetical protein n=1 Tax=Flavisolibacter nicotianae TaxID=2364882 RepID=UPI000EB3E0AA|nr:hypothetical protein [Flavisolibacter nicotianae]
MKLEQAIALREQYANLIGQKAKDLDAHVFDVLVVPVDGFQRFISEYRDNLEDVSNDEMLLDFPSREYTVKVLYDTDPEFVDLYTDDLYEFLKNQQ